MVLQRDRILLPGERVGRRSLLRHGILGGALLATGGTFLALRGTQRAADLRGSFSVFNLDEASIVAAMARRFFPARDGFPSPDEIQVASKVDGILAMLHPGAQKEMKQLIRLFENAFTGFLFDRQPNAFTNLTPDGQDERLNAWRESRIAVRRTGYRALKGLCCAAYYASPESYAAVGYPGPPELAAPVDSEGR